jgi:hypothetical protein
MRPGQLHNWVEINIKLISSGILVNVQFACGGNGFTCGENRVTGEEIIQYQRFKSYSGPV